MTEQGENKKLAEIKATKAAVAEDADVTPGRRIREELSARGMLQKEFALRMGMTEKHVSKLINGEVQLTVDVSVRLETVLGIPAATWNALEAAFREKKIREENEKLAEGDVALAQCFPYAEMARLGWVPKAKNDREKVLRLKDFFETTDLKHLEIAQLYGVAGRKLSLQDKEDLAILAWTQAGRRKARDVRLEPFQGKKLERIIPEIRALTTERPASFYQKLRELLSECGVGLVVLPRIRGLVLQSAAFPSGSGVVIALTEKKMDDSEFWQRLFHELGHVFLGHVWQEEDNTEQDERDARLWARGALLPRTEYDKFKQGGVYTEKSLREFAAEQGLAAGILVGRLQTDGLIGGGNLNRLKTKYDFSKEVKPFDGRG